MGGNLKSKIMFDKIMLLILNFYTQKCHNLFFFKASPLIRYFLSKLKLLPMLCFLIELHRLVWKESLLEWCNLQADQQHLQMYVQIRMDRALVRRQNDIV